MLIRKAELQDVRAVYALICELEEQTAAQFEFLKSVGCDYIQGYFSAEDLMQKNFMIADKKAELQDVRAVIRGAGFACRYMAC